MGSLQSFKIYKYFRVPRMRVWHVSTMQCHRAPRPPMHRWFLPQSIAILRPPAQSRPSAWSPLGWESSWSTPRLPCVGNLILQKMRTCVAVVIESKGLPRSVCKGEPRCWNLCGPPSRIPNTSKATMHACLSRFMVATPQAWEKHDMNAKQQGRLDSSLTCRKQWLRPMPQSF
jgi:hypothetical protein